MPKPPLVSVITICYNAEESITKTIESVIAQTYPNVEYIIIDGKSRDGTLDVIKQYRKHIDVLISEKDDGIADAFNKGIKLSNGKYIQLLNADDYLPSSKIKVSVEEFEESPWAGFIFGDIIKVNKEGDMLFKVKGDSNYHRSVRFVCPRFSHPSMMVKKKIYEKYGLFDTSWNIGMDYEWFLRIYKKGVRGKYSDRIFTYMRDDGISSNWKKTLKEDYMISKYHGLPTTVAGIVYLFRFLKVTVRIQLERILGDKFLFLFRKGKTKKVINE